MKKKQERLKTMLRLIEENPIETQEELAEQLKNLGFEVTQATVSRDIRELNLKKVPGEGGGMRYSAGKDYGVSSGRYENVLKSGYLSAAFAEKLIVLRTVSGMAMAVAAAIDNMELEGVAGCIAGDDTIFIALSEGADQTDVLKELQTRNF